MLDGARYLAWARTPSQTGTWCQRRDVRNAQWFLSNAHTHTHTLCSASTDPLLGNRRAVIKLKATFVFEVFLTAAEAFSQKVVPKFPNLFLFKWTDVLQWPYENLWRAGDSPGERRSHFGSHKAGLKDLWNVGLWWLDVWQALLSLVWLVTKSQGYASKRLHGLWNAAETTGYIFHQLASLVQDVVSLSLYLQFGSLMTVRLKIYRLTKTLIHCFQLSSTLWGFLSPLLSCLFLQSSSALLTSTFNSS